MIERLVDFSARNRYTVVACILLLSVLGWWSMHRLSVDALPDLNETQVIVQASWDRSANTIEDQLTYPLVTSLASLPHIKAVRGVSDFGSAFIYVIFADGTDLDWARTRTLEQVSSVQSQLPEGAKVRLGPAASGLDWVYQYVLFDHTGPAALRTFQDYTLRYALQSVPGVAEVASVGGFERQFQVNVDPRRLAAYGLTIREVVEAVRGGNSEAGGRLLEFGGSEYMVRGRGAAQSVADFENLLVKTTPAGLPVYVRDLGQVSLGPELRRGATDLDGKGEVVSGTVIMRSGENALDVIARVKARLQQLSSSMPPGVVIQPVYDRSVLINAAIANVRETVFEILAAVAIVILIFLWHAPSAVIPLITIPVVLLLSFVPLRIAGVGANIMSLSGLAIALSELVDASIVVVEQTYKKLEQWDRDGQRRRYQDVVLEAIRQVTRPAFFAMLILAVSFVPVLALEGQAGRTFKPLALAKIAAVLIAAVLAVTLDPALRLMLTRREPFATRSRAANRILDALLIGRLRPESEHPISGRLARRYQPVILWTLGHKRIVLGGALLAFVLTVPVLLALGSEFLPPFDEGSILYMPSTPPGIALPEAQRLLRITDRILKQFPEVETVFGKAGRGNSATDPAPLSMLETVITLKPHDRWRPRHTWYSAWAPEWLKPALRHVTADTISEEQLIDEMNRALRIPGLTNAWTMPIKGRTDMLATGVRTPLGLKITGPDPAELERIGVRAQALLPSVKGTRSVFAERAAMGTAFDIEWDRRALAEHGLTLAEAQDTVQNGIGGENVTTALVGRERVPVNVRYMRDFRSDPGAIEQMMIPTGAGKQIPLREVATLARVASPSMLRDEDGRLTSYVYIDIEGRDPSSYMNKAQQLLQSRLELPPGYAWQWTGTYDAMQRVRQRLAWIVPSVLAIIVGLLLISTRSAIKTVIVLMAVPFSAIGAVWFLYLLHYNLSVAVWVGLIALLGVDAQTGVFMLLYLDLAYEQAREEGRLSTLGQLRAAIYEGAAKRLRPKLMTFGTTCIALLPVMWSTGVGSEIMKRIAAPMIGGIGTSFLLELLIYPVLYELWRGQSLDRRASLEDEPSLEALCQDA